MYVRMYVRLAFTSFVSDEVREVYLHVQTSNKTAWPGDDCRSFENFLKGLGFPVP